MSTTTIDFDDLFRREYRPMVSFAYRNLGNWADAEDAVQRAFTSAWEHRADFNGAPAAAGAWVQKFVNHKVIHVRREGRRYVPVGGWENEFGYEFKDVQVEPVGGRCLADEDIRNRVGALLNVITSREREVVELHVLKMVSAKEAGERLGIATKTVRSLLRSALERIVKHLAELDAVAVEPTVQAKRGVLSPEAELVRHRADLLDKLTERQRQVLVLRYIKLMPGPAVAKRLGISKATVRRSTAMARRRLRAAVPDLIPA